MAKTTEERYKELLAKGDSYQQQANDYLAAYDNRPAFSYDASTDPLYRSVRDQHIHNGQRAMQDTMGQAAGLTGGYGSSYAQAVGNQAYNEYMTKLGGIAGEYAQQARSAYDAEGQRMLDRYGMALNAANTAYNQGRDALADQRYDQERNYSMAMQMIQAGQTPDAALLTSAGIDPAYAKNMAGYYANLNAGYGSGGSGGSGSGGSGKSSGGGGGLDYSGLGGGNGKITDGQRNEILEYMKKYGSDAGEKLFTKNFSPDSYSNYDEIRQWLISEYRKWEAAQRKSSGQTGAGGGSGGKGGETRDIRIN